MDLSKIMEHLAPIAHHFDPEMLNYLDLIAAHTKPQTLKAGECFPLPGQEDYQGMFIVDGIFRVYSEDALGKETTIRLPSEGDFTMYLEDYKTLSPDVEYRLEAVTDATVLTWSRENLEFLAQRIPQWYFLALKITQTLVLRLTIERGEMFNDDATTRYLKFAERYPRTIARVPLRHVANYLGIAPQSLSRIRQQLNKSQTN